MLIGELFSLTSNGFEKLTKISRDPVISVEGKKYLIEQLNNGCLKLTHTGSKDNRKQKYESAVEKLQNEIDKRKNDITALDLEVKILIKKARVFEDGDNTLADELVNKTLLISKHRREIKKIKSKICVEITYQQKLIRHSLELRPFIIKFVPFWNKEIIWCPIKKINKKRKFEENMIHFKTIERISTEKIEPGFFKNYRMEKLENTWNGTSKITELRSLVGHQLLLQTKTIHHSFKNIWVECGSINNSNQRLEVQCLDTDHAIYQCELASTEDNTMYLYKGAIFPIVKYKIIAVALDSSAIRECNFVF